MIVARQCEPVEWLVAIVTGVGAYSQSNLGPDSGIKLCHVLDISNNNIRTGHKVWHSGTDCMLHGRHDHRLRFTPNKLVDLERLHRRADGNCSGQ
jgi:hypothetical protein